ncbi:zinc finger protein 16-like isoform X2 [Ambystoma mexicanum]|uniref:zinc finger protein 16-like isoform X2 n=1 Tax=Ambystoma mexicanum TaxID=8296 RepID=UPI0037E751FB
MPPKRILTHEDAENVKRRRNEAQRIRRTNMTEQQRASQREKNAASKRKNRATMTAREKALRLDMQRLRTAARRKNMTDAERDLEREKNRERNKNVRATIANQENAAKRKFNDVTVQRRVSQTCREIAASFSEDELETFKERLDVDYQNVSMEATDHSMCSSKDPVFNPESSLWIKEVEAYELSDPVDSEESRSSHSTNNPAFDLDIASSIKQEEDSDFIGTEDSNDSDCSGEGKRIEYATRSKTGAQPIKNVRIKEESNSSDVDSTKEDNTSVSISRKPGSEKKKKKERSSEDSTVQCSDKTISLERQTNPQGYVTCVSEYRLDRISLYETGFCVITDPFVSMGNQPHDMLCNHPPLLEKPKLYTYSDQVRLHEIVHKGDQPNVETLPPKRGRPLICAECKKRFLDNASLVEHKKAHVEKHHNNSQSDASFRSIKAHTEVKEPNLETIANTRTSYRYKQCGNRAKHPVKQPVRKPYACSKCVKCFFWKTDLIKHMKNHIEKSPEHIASMGHLLDCSGPMKNPDFDTETFQDNFPKEEKYFCSKCEIIFSCRSSLLSHQRTHTEGCPYTCSKCDKSFRYISTLYKHQTMHINPTEKPYQCSECGERFEQTSSLAKHRRTHSIERPYKCYECEKSFTQNSNLIRHQKTHREEKRNSARLLHQRANKKETDSDNEFKDIPSPTQPSVTNCDKRFNLQPGSLRTQVHVMDINTDSNLKVTTPARYQETHHRVIDFDDIFIDMELQPKENEFNNAIQYFHEHRFKKWFSCGNCGQRFSEHLLLIKHERIHI